MFRSLPWRDAGNRLQTHAIIPECISRTSDGLKGFQRANETSAVHNSDHLSGARTFTEELMLSDDDVASSSHINRNRLFATQFPSLTSKTRKRRHLCDTRQTLEDLLMRRCVK